MNRNVSRDKHDLLACVNMMDYPSDVINMHKSSVVLRFERGCSACNDVTFNQ